MRLVYILILFLATGVIARAAEPPLSLSAYAIQADSARVATLVIGVRVDAPAVVSVRVMLPPGWSGAVDWGAQVTGAEVRTFRLVAAAGAPAGLGAIVVEAADDHGHRIVGRAYVRAPGERAGPAQRPGRLWMPLVRT